MPIKKKATLLLEQFTQKNPEVVKPEHKETQQLLTHEFRQHMVQRLAVSEALRVLLDEFVASKGTTSAAIKQVQRTNSNLINTARGCTVQALQEISNHVKAAKEGVDVSNEMTKINAVWYTLVGLLTTKMVPIWWALRIQSIGKKN